ncbi:histone deacetylase [Aspergillus wentii]|nr:histone deacetylase [Aspergillus wentii]
MDNANTKEYLDKIRTQVVENLKRTAFAPSVQMTDVPRDPLVGGMDDEADAILDDLDEDENKDKRFTQRRFDQYVEKPGELSDSEDEDENAANGVRRQPNAIRRRNEANHRNLGVDSGLDSGIATPRDESSIADEEMDTTADAKMGEAPEAEAEERLSPSAAEPPSRAEEASAAEPSEMAVDGQEQGASAPISRQTSPKVQDEDTTMEDAGAPEPQPEEPEEPAPAPEKKAQSEPQEGESKPADETPQPDKTATEPSFPSKAKSPSKETSGVGPAETAGATEGTEPTKTTETGESQAAETTEKAPEAPEAPQTTEAARDTQATEAPKDESAPVKAEQETSEESNSKQQPEEPAKNEE